MIIISIIYCLSENESENENENENENERSVYYFVIMMDIQNNTWDKYSICCELYVSIMIIVLLWYIESMNRECFVVWYSMNSNDEEENDGMIK